MSAQGPTPEDAKRQILAVAATCDDGAALTLGSALEVLLTAQARLSAPLRIFADMNTQRPPAGISIGRWRLYIAGAISALAAASLPTPPAPSSDT